MKVKNEVKFVDAELKNKIKKQYFFTFFEKKSSLHLLLNVMFMLYLVMN